MSGLPEYVLSLLDQIAIDEGFVDAQKNVVSGSNHGDNFLGILTSVVLRGQRNGCNDAELHLLCKLAPDNVHRREAFKSESVFKRECEAYNQILPTFLAFQLAKGVNENDCFTAYPKCYAAVANADTNEFIVIMEDLRPKGFLMRPKCETNDADHSRLVMEQLGRFHGISFAMKDQQPEVFVRFTRLNDLFGLILESPVLAVVVERALRRGENAIDNQKHLTKVKKLTANWRGVTVECLSADSTRFAVVTHGDTWNNNLLYTYNEERKVQTICIVDWQICRYASPVHDILYNLFTSTDGALRAKEYQNLIAHYHRSLSKTIRQLGSNPDALFSFNDLQNELKRFGKLAIITSPLMLRIILADPKDIRNYDQLKDPNEEAKDETNYSQLDANADDAFRKRYSDIVSDIIDYGYLECV